MLISVQLNEQNLPLPSLDSLDLPPTPSPPTPLPLHLIYPLHPSTPLQPSTAPNTVCLRFAQPTLQTFYNLTNLQGYDRGKIGSTNPSSFIHNMAPFLKRGIYLIWFLIGVLEAYIVSYCVARLTVFHAVENYAEWKGGPRQDYIAKRDQEPGQGWEYQLFSPMIKLEEAVTNYVHNVD